MKPTYVNFQMTKDQTENNLFMGISNNPEKAETMEVYCERLRLKTHPVGITGFRLCAVTLSGFR